MLMKKFIILTVIAFSVSFANAQWQKINGTCGIIDCVASSDTSFVRGD